MPQFAVDVVAQHNTGHVKLGMRSGHALDITRHAWRFAQYDVDGYVNRPRFAAVRLYVERRCRGGAIVSRQAFAESDTQLAFFGSDPHNSVRTAFAPGDKIEALQVVW